MTQWMLFKKALTWMTTDSILVEELKDRLKNGEILVFSVMQMPFVGHAIAKGYMVTNMDFFFSRSFKVPFQRPFLCAIKKGQLMLEILLVIRHISQCQVYLYHQLI